MIVFSVKLKDLLDMTLMHTLTFAPFLIDLVLNVTVMYTDLPRLPTVSDSLSHLKLEGTNLLSNHFMCVSFVLPGLLSNLLLRHGNKY